VGSDFKEVFQNITSVLGKADLLYRMKSVSTLSLPTGEESPALDNTNTTELERPKWDKGGRTHEATKSAKQEISKNHEASKDAKRSKNAEGSKKKNVLRTDVFNHLAYAAAGLKMHGLGVKRTAAVQAVKMLFKNGKNRKELMFDFGTKIAGYQGATMKLKGDQCADTVGVPDVVKKLLTSVLESEEGLTSVPGDGSLLLDFSAEKDTEFRDYVRDKTFDGKLKTLLLSVSLFGCVIFNGPFL
jgi:hypothetical protein